MSPQLSSGGWSLKKLKCSKSFHCNTQGLQCVEPQDLEAGIGEDKKTYFLPSPSMAGGGWDGSQCRGLLASG